MSHCGARRALANLAACTLPSVNPPLSCSYEEGGNISDAAVLLEVGRELGLPEQELQAALG